MGLALVAGLSTSCSNGDWEDSLQGGTANGGNNGKISVYFSMQALSALSPLVMTMMQ